jgi:hypothetical protein
LGNGEYHNQKLIAMILKRLNPNASVDNALKFTNLSGLCCGDKGAAVVCTYTATLGSIIGTTAVSSVNINGTTYTLDGAYLVNQERERDALVDNIIRIINDLGYDGKGNVTQSFSAGTMTLTVEYSDLEFGWLSTDATPFIPTACQVIGDPVAFAGTCDAGAAIYKSGTNLIVKPFAAGAVTNVTINDGGGDVYNGDLTNGTTGNATVSGTTGSKVITVNGASGGENWSGTITFTVSVTQSGCAAWTRTIKLVY